VEGFSDSSEPLSTFNSVLIYFSGRRTAKIFPEYVCQDKVKKSEIEKPVIFAALWDSLQGFFRLSDSFPLGRFF